MLVLFLSAAGTAMFLTVGAPAAWLLDWGGDDVVLSPSLATWVWERREADVLASLINWDLIRFSSITYPVLAK